MVTVTFADVTRTTDPIGKCLHCESSATVTPTRVNDGRSMPVKFCDEHAAMRGVRFDGIEVAGTEQTVRDRQPESVKFTRRCEMCNKEFPAKRVTARFCSDRHRKKFRRLQ